MIHERPGCAVALKKFLPSTRLRHPFFTTILDDRNPTLLTSENSSRHSKRNHFFRISDMNNEQPWRAIQAMIAVNGAAIRKRRENLRKCRQRLVQDVLRNKRR